MQEHQQRSMAGWFVRSLLVALKSIRQWAALYRCCVRHGIGLQISLMEIKSHLSMQAMTMVNAGFRRSCKQAWQIGEEDLVLNCDKLSSTQF